ncbi:MAG: UPF0149 family protein [Endozoicomonadaceae bacterium]|nr:UPF0149 family protein [Endozoicomonadaceae bacterium]
MTTNVSELIPVGFDRLSSLFLELRSYQSPSELHGLLCGQCCAGFRLTRNDWLAMVVEHMAISQPLESDVKSTLFQLYDDTLAQLKSEYYYFQPLLPDDDEPLGQRAQVIGQWCQGFLGGYGLSGRAADELSEEATSILKDFASIAQIAFDDLDESESSEKDFFEICEYLRIAALMLFGEHNEPDGATEKSTAQLH